MMAWRQRGTRLRLDPDPRASQSEARSKPELATMALGESYLWQDRLLMPAATRDYRTNAESCTELRRRMEAMFVIDARLLTSAWVLRALLAAPGRWELSSLMICLSHFPGTSFSYPGAILALLPGKGLRAEGSRGEIWWARAEIAIDCGQLERIERLHV